MLAPMKTIAAPMNTYQHQLIRLGRVWRSSARALGGPRLHRVRKNKEPHSFNKRGPKTVLLEKSQVFSSQKAPARTTSRAQDLNNPNNQVFSSQKVPAGTTSGAQDLKNPQKHVFSSQKAPASTGFEKIARLWGGAIAWGLQCIFTYGQTVDTFETLLTPY